MPKKSFIIGVIILSLAAWPLIAAAQDRPMTDSQISNAVSGALLTDEGVAAHKIDVSTSEGVVELTGAVDNLLAKRRAERVAETIKGVTAVINEIRVIRWDRPDSAVSQDVQNALLVNPTTEDWEVDVSVEDNVVELTGRVDSWQERRMAERLAQGVRGVVAVENNIKVVFEQERPDGEIAEEIRSALHWDALVDDALIQVEVDDGVVELAGTVGSAAEKRRAVGRAWTAGVEVVRADNLEPAGFGRQARFREGEYEEKTDAEIKEAVIKALLFQPELEQGEIKVTVEDGRVSLSGAVQGLDAKRAAERTAKNVVGVHRVKNYLAVRPTAAPPDDEVAENVKSALISDPYVNRYDLAVSVFNGQVYLAGTVDSTFEKAQAEDVAASIAGVTAVNNNIRVQDATEIVVSDPYVDQDWDLYDYDWYEYPNLLSTVKPDWEILEDIEDELWWSPFVDSDDIDIEVENGVATLSGEVEDLAERRFALDNALEGGAIAVIDHLNVTYGPQEGE